MLRVGSRIVIDGLVARADLNGMVGVITRYSEEQQRWIVQVDGEPKKLALKPSCLELLATFPLDALPTELSRLVLDHLPHGALARLALTNRAWAEQVAAVLLDFGRSHTALLKRIAAATTFDELDHEASWVRAHPRLHLDDVCTYELNLDDFRNPAAATFLGRDGTTTAAFRIMDITGWTSYKGRQLGKYSSLDDAAEMLVAAKCCLCLLIRLAPAARIADMTNSIIAASLRLEPNGFIKFASDFAGTFDISCARVPQYQVCYIPHMQIDAMLTAGCRLLRRAEWTPTLLIRLTELCFDQDSFDSDICEAYRLEDEFREVSCIFGGAFWDEFRQLYRPPELPDSQHFWLHFHCSQIEDYDCVTFDPDELSSAGLVAHAATLGGEALASLLAIARDAVDTKIDDAGDIGFYDGFEEEAQSWRDCVDGFFAAWTRKVRFPISFVDRDDSQAYIDMIARQPRNFKQQISHLAISWIGELLSTNHVEFAKKICNALR